MNSKPLTKTELLKKFKQDTVRFNHLCSDGIIEDTNLFTEKDAERIRSYRKENPIGREEILKRFKIPSHIFDLIIENKLVKDKYFYSENEIEVLKSFGRLKKLGYSDSSCLKILLEVGIPEVEDLSQDQRYIQLKPLAETTNIPERTIKFYEKSSVIKKPRIYKNKRFYEKDIINELELIRDLQQIGYKLNDISILLTSMRENQTGENERITQLKRELTDKKQIIDTIMAKL